MIVPLWPPTSLASVRRCIQEICPLWRSFEVNSNGKYFGFIVGPGAEQDSWIAPLKQVRREGSLLGLHWWRPFWTEGRRNWKLLWEINCVFAVMEVVRRLSTQHWTYDTHCWHQWLQAGLHLQMWTGSWGTRKSGLYYLTTPRRAQADTQTKLHNGLK